MPWAVAAAAIGASATVYASKQAKKAGETQARGYDEAAALQAEQAAQTRADLAPWVGTGGEANMTLARLLGLPSGTTGTTPPTRSQIEQAHRAEHVSRYGVEPSGQWLPLFNQQVDDLYKQALANYSSTTTPTPAGFGDLLRSFTPTDLTNEPGYQFQLEEGEKGINRGALARGMYDSGPTLKELLRYNQGLAGTTYQNAWQRDAANKARIFGMLSDVSGRGQSSAAQTGTLGANYAGMIGQNLIGGQSSLAGGQVGSANAISGGASGIANNLLGYYTLNTLMNRPTMSYDKAYNIGYGPSGYNWG